MTEMQVNELPESRRVRIGIDVGGTFTDAVAIHDETYEVLGHAKVPTTHTAPQGVALGIIQALTHLLHQSGIAAEQVRFIAHGTTQATNALLEGDVVPVGIIAMGSGLEGHRARSETQIGDIELAPGKLLHSRYAFLESSSTPEQIISAVQLLKEQGTQVIVAAESFSVDDPSGELQIIEAAQSLGLLATGTHEITKLYGLRIRTRTAVVNASILPRMTEAADKTALSVHEAGIAVPLMIMRGDGGVMSVAEVRRRPILTLMSGPAAGVAGALMSEKISDGLFLEVGGTSTDISAVRGGRVSVEFAEVGRHKTYVSSLDIRTMGVAGGSMIRVEKKRIIDVGPRSAHIAGLPYAVYADPTEIVEPVLEYYAPLQGDPADYVVIRCAGDKRFALTTACAANLLGYVQDGDYAIGNSESARRAFVPLAAELGCDVEEAARAVLLMVAQRLSPVVEALLLRYDLDKRHTTLIGGGGGCAVIVPFLAEFLEMKSRLAAFHQVISPIGVALALVRDVVERTVPHAKEDDILRIRQEAVAAAIKSGAAPETVQVHVEVDAVRNIVRAIATGATELRTKDRAQRRLSEQELREVAEASMGTEKVEVIAQYQRWFIYRGLVAQKGWLGLKSRVKPLYRILDDEGVVRLAENSGELQVREAMLRELTGVLEQSLAKATTYGDAGAIVPATYLLYNSRLIDLSGLASLEQVLEVAGAELKGGEPHETAVVLCIPRR